MSRTARAALAALASILLAGCAASTTTPEAASGYTLLHVPASDAGAVEIAPGWLRHPVHGLLPVHRTDAAGWWLRIADVDPASPPPPLTPAPSARPPGLPLTAQGTLVEHDRGLPRRGQWRDRFALHRGDDGALLLTAPPARKSLSLPQRWRQDAAGRWQPVAIAAPRLGYDYGAAAIGDFDADGTADIGLAMHLRGFAALLAGTDGAWRDASSGLPSLAPDADAGGSGTALAVLPDQRGDRLVLLRESLGVSSADPAPGLAEYHWDGRRWQAVPIASALRGRALALAEVGRCPPLLAVESDSFNALPLFERRRGRWHSIAIPLDHGERWTVTALIAGDFDGTGCADLAVARRQRSARGWRATLEVWRRDRGAWQALPIIERDDAQFTAIDAWAEPDGATGLLIGDDRGRLDRYRIDAGSAQWIAHLPAAPWRDACAVSALAGWVDAAGERRWIASFAGEPALLAPTRCPPRGGLVDVEWRAMD